VTALERHSIRLVGIACAPEGFVLSDSPLIVLDVYQSARFHHPCVALIIDGVDDFWVTIGGERVEVAWRNERRAEVPVDPVKHLGRMLRVMVREPINMFRG